MYWNKREPNASVEVIERENVTGGRRTFASVKNRFSKLRYAMQLYRFDARLRKVSMAKINQEVYKLFLEKRNNGVIVHDRHLRIWALQIKNKLDPLDTIQFKAFQGWVSYFKKKRKLFRAE